MVIWKFRLDVTDVQKVEMPTGAQLLHVANQHVGETDALTLWALIDPSRKSVARQIHIVGTGNPVPTYGIQYVGSVQQGSFVWHVFDGGEGGIQVRAV